MRIRCNMESLGLETGSSSLEREASVHQITGAIITSKVQIINPGFLDNITTDCEPELIRLDDEVHDTFTTSKYNPEQSLNANRNNKESVIPKILKPSREKNHYQCKFCCQSFSMLRYLRKHFTTPTGQLPTKCQEHYNFGMGNSQLSILDSFCTKKVDIIKTAEISIDDEGDEIQILRVITKSNVCLPKRIVGIRNNNKIYKNSEKNSPTERRSDNQEIDKQCEFVRQKLVLSNFAKNPDQHGLTASGNLNASDNDHEIEIVATISNGDKNNENCKSQQRYNCQNMSPPINVENDKEISIVDLQDKTPTAQTKTPEERHPTCTSNGHSSIDDATHNKLATIPPVRPKIFRKKRKRIVTRNKKDNCIKSRVCQQQSFGSYYYLSKHKRSCRRCKRYTTKLPRKKLLRGVEGNEITGLQNNKQETRSSKNQGNKNPKIVRKWEVQLTECFKLKFFKKPAITAHDQNNNVSKIRQMKSSSSQTLPNHAIIPCKSRTYSRQRKVCPRDGKCNPSLTQETPQKPIQLQDHSTCNICKQNFITEELLKHHQLTAHQEEEHALMKFDPELPEEVKEDQNHNKCEENFQVCFETIPLPSIGVKDEIPVLNTVKPHPVAQVISCKVCQLTCASLKDLCIHYSRNHSLPLILLTRVNEQEFFKNHNRRIKSCHNNNCLKCYTCRHIFPRRNHLKNHTTTRQCAIQPSLDCQKTVKTDVSSSKINPPLSRFNFDSFNQNSVNKNLQKHSNYYKLLKKRLIQLSLLKKLRLPNNGQSYYKCHTCKRKFSSIQILKRHKLAFHKEKKSSHNVVRQRQEKLISTVKVRELENQVTHKSCHTCNLCKQDFPTQLQLTQHSLAVHQPNPLECDVCHKKYTCTGNLNAHKLSMHEGFRYKCDLCQKEYTKEQYLKEHKRATHEGWYHKCEFCPKKFTNLYNLIRHKQTAHNGYRHTCNICLREFTTFHTLKHHKLTVHHDDCYKCELCFETFTELRTLKRHKFTLHDGVRYKCELCPKMYTHLLNFEKHKLSAHDGARHNCELCSKSFSQLQNLKKHKLSAHDGVRHHCEFCSKTFSQLRNLRQHKLGAHEGFRYKCDFCPKTFTRLSYLKKHTTHCVGR